MNFRQGSLLAKSRHRAEACRFCSCIVTHARAEIRKNMKITPNIIASLTGGIVEGDGELPIVGFGKIEEAGEGCVTFIANPKYANYIYTTKASAVIV
ncbi:MAG: hypothetical protein K2L83_05880, partial [Muribaculaceae bacterium]|nr:hypothetical protein [Muribaculaceae bacterium]